MLTTSKVIAGGLAAATTAVLGSYFGVLGTVGAAAATSVVSAISSEIYQKSLDRTTGRARSRTARTPDQRVPGQSVSRQSVPSPPRARRSVLPRIALGSLLIFALAIGTVSGVEYARGAPLSGGSGGTSIGDAIAGTLQPSVGGLLGTSRQSPDSSDDSRPNHQDRPGVVNGLLSGL